MITLQSVSKAFGASQALADVSLTLPAGQITALIGASGSGKSTLLRLINRLVQPDSGQVLLNGQDISALAPDALRRRMGYVIQSGGLFPHWTVARNIATVPRLLGWPAARIDARIDELLALLGLAPPVYRQRYPHQLSGGQQQRVGVARALAARPEILLMDEPFGALDPLTRSALQAALLRIQRASGQTIVLVTHDIDEALHLAHQVVLLDHGRVLQAGAPAQLLGQPASTAVADFLGRAQTGLRLLALQSVADRLRPVAALGAAAAAADNPAISAIDANRPISAISAISAISPVSPISASLNLRDALSLALARQVDRLPVVDAIGRPLGTLHLADLLRPAP